MILRIVSNGGVNHEFTEDEINKETMEAIAENFYDTPNTGSTAISTLDDNYFVFNYSNVFAMVLIR